MLSQRATASRNLTCLVFPHRIVRDNVDGRNSMKNLQTKLLIVVLVVAVLAALAFVPSLLEKRNNSPIFFGRAVFGQDFDDPATVVHFIVRGNEIFVDMNKDDIPQPEELNREKRLPELSDADAGISYDIHELRLGIAPESASEQLPQQLGMTVNVRGEFSFQQLGTVVLSTSPQNVSYVQFNGPISLIYTDHDLQLPKGGPETPIRVLAGSVANAANRSETVDQQEIQEPAPPTFSLSRISYVVPEPENAAPMLKIEYPTDDQPIVEEFRLDTMC